MTTTADTAIEDLDSGPQTLLQGAALDDGQLPDATEDTGQGQAEMPAAGLPVAPVQPPPPAAPAASASSEGPLALFPEELYNKFHPKRVSLCDALRALYYYSDLEGVHHPPGITLRGKRDAFVHSGTGKPFFRGRAGKVALWIRMHAGSGPGGADARRRASHPVQAGEGDASRALVATRVALTNLLALTLDSAAHEDDLIAQLAAILEPDFYTCLEDSMGYYPPPSPPPPSLPPSPPTSPSPSPPPSSPDEAMDRTAVEDLDSGPQTLLEDATTTDGQLPDAAVSARILRSVLDEAQRHSTQRTLTMADELLAGRLLANGERSEQVVNVLVELQSEHDTLEFTRALNDAEALASEQLVAEAQGTVRRILAARSPAYREATEVMLRQQQPEAPTQNT